MKTTFIYILILAAGPLLASFTAEPAHACNPRIQQCGG